MKIGYVGECKNRRNFISKMIVCDYFQNNLFSSNNNCDDCYDYIITNSYTIQNNNYYFSQ